ncbi:salicylate 1-monooxygenase [Stutzerimonas nitrititolerans]|uniref:salicylate 1-monooxygenase n=1 Tax=Stutzerimonas nitrititolerans TaxID=2482751 RepID=UPI002896D82F|nr:salicylate 1-monooxygenase [Stutzerimonas nitrititolerans]
MSMKKPALRIGIVGGGIASVALALDLSRRSQLEVKLFESAPAFGEVGAGVSFGANAVRAIAGLGIGEPYLQTADRTPAPWDDVWFEWRRGVDAGYLSASFAPGVGQSSVHRADFLNTLASRLPNNVPVFNKRAQQVEQTGSATSVTFSDGSVYECDLLIAADGIKSSIRPHVLNSIGAEVVAPRFSATCAYRGLIDSQLLRDANRAQGVDEHLIDVPQMYLGLDAHILTFPVKQGRIINVVAFVSDRSTATPVWPSDKPWVNSADQKVMLKAFADWGDAPRILLECIASPTYWALHDLAELPGYVHGRVALIGDAAHAMLSHQGQVQGRAWRMPGCSGNLLGDSQMLDTDPAAVLKVYDEARRPRACRLQRAPPGRRENSMKCVTLW